MTNKIVKLTDVEHVLQRPNMYIGSVKPADHNGFFLNPNTDKFEYSTYTSVDGLLKIINEIIDNSLDEAIKTNYEYSNEIKVAINEKQVIIIDNGRGISTDLEKTTGEPQALVAFTHPKAGSNFVDDRQSIGMNGVGSFCTNVFSKSFHVITENGKEKFELKCKNNLSTKDWTTTKSKNRGTTVKFYPDLTKFGMDHIDETHINLIKQRIIQLAMSFPQITFKFNGKIVRTNSSKKYLKMFDDTFEFIDSDNYLIGIFPNDTDNFIHFSFVNGLEMKEGGNHIDNIMNTTVYHIKQKLARKYKSIKPGDIYNKLKAVIFFKNFPNPDFDSQTKEKLKNSAIEIKKYLGNDFNHEEFAKKILRNKNIIEPIIEMFKIKEEFKKKQQLNSLNKNKPKKIKSDKYLSHTKKSEYFFICEGDSASGGLSSALGRENFAYYATRGVPLNAYDCNIQKIIANKEIKEISDILNLTFDKDKEDKPRYDKIVIATDADADGAHITGLYIGTFYKYFKNILKDHMYKLMTPIITLNDNKGNIKKYFFTIDEYNGYIKNNNIKNLKSKYYKGLGSWKATDLRELVNKYGIEKFVVKFNYMNDSNIIDHWMNTKQVEKRKEYLRKNEFDLFSI